MTKREAQEYNWMIDRMRALGISQDDCEALRRISMTLRRWSELECGNSNDYASWAIERDEQTEKPYMVTHYHRPPFQTHRSLIADRETGAKRRLAAIMAKYPRLTPYVQGDPRGCALYILRETDKIEGHDIGSYYSRGLAVA